MTEIVPITIIGGGAVGCAIANELATLDEVVLVERNKSIRGENQSSRNSGVIHAGVYYDKRTMPLKAILCVEGNELMYSFCEQNNVPHKKVGKLLIATDELEEEYLEDVIRIAEEHKVPGVRKISIEDAQLMEPNVSGKAALYVPTSGVIDATGLVMKLYQLAMQNGVAFLTNNKVVNIEPKSRYFKVTVDNDGEIEKFKTKILINSAGLYSDEIARMVNPESPYRIVPVRGEAAKFYKDKREDIEMNCMNVYPAPYGYYNATGERARISFSEFQRLLKEGVVTKTVGIHLTPTLDANGSIGNIVTIGPAKTVGLGKEDYSSNLKEPKYFYLRVKSFFPNLRADDVQLHQAGIMAVLENHSDWVIERDKKYRNMINLIGIDSPGLTASLAIAGYVRGMITGRS